jgi:hypothetical protein
VVASNCANCGTALSDRYCGSCGQDSRLRLDFRDFVGSVAEGLFNLDSRLWRTLRALCVPGLLTAEFLAGRRARYLPPVQTYLVSALLFFALLPPGTYAALSDDAYRASVSSRAAARGISRDQQSAEDRAKNQAWEAERKEFERRSTRFSALMFVLLPFLALALFATHQSLPFRYLEHLVFALHLQTFIWFVLAALLGVEWLLFAWWLPSVPAIAWAIAVVGLLAHSLVALRRVTGAPWPSVVLRFAGILAAYLLMLGSMGTAVERLWGSA